MRSFCHEGEDDTQALEGLNLIVQVSNVLEFRLKSTCDIHAGPDNKAKLTYPLAPLVCMSRQCLETPEYLYLKGQRLFKHNL